MIAGVRRGPLQDLRFSRLGDQRQCDARPVRHLVGVLIRDDVVAKSVGCILRDVDGTLSARCFLL